MNKQIIVDYIGSLQVTPDQINESIAKNDGRLIVSGIMQRGSTQSDENFNQNGRSYPIPILKREADKYKRVFVTERRALGELDHPEEIIAMHLVADHNDLVLLLGYNLTEVTTQDKYQRHKQLNYQNAFRATLNTYPNVQFVLIDHSGDLDKSFKNISNITCDKFESVLQLLN